MGHIAPLIAVTAATNERNRLNAEEERMAGYASEDLEGEWEFKIVRSDTAAFRKREAREQDAYLPKGVDPYRSHYGTPMVTYSVMAGVLLVVLILGLAFLMFALVS